MLSDLAFEDVAQEAMLKEVKFEEANCIDDDDDKKTASGDCYVARRPEFLGTKGSVLRRKTSETSEGPGLLTGVVGKRARDRLRKKRARLYKFWRQDDNRDIRRRHRGLETIAQRFWILFEIHSR